MRTRIATFLDGARLWNVAVATGIALSALAAPFDLVAVALTKGLGAPCGSLLAGSRTRIEQAARSGACSAVRCASPAFSPPPACMRSTTISQRLAEDHANARLIAEPLAQSPRIRLDLATAQTNILVFELAPDAPDAPTVVARARERGLLIFDFGPRTVRAVTHLDVTREQCARAGEILLQSSCHGRLTLATASSVGLAPARTTPRSTPRSRRPRPATRRCRRNPARRNSAANSRGEYL